MFGIGREDLRYVREWSEGSPLSPRVVGRPSVKSGSGREVRPNVREWSGGPLGCSELVGRTSVMSGSGRKGLR